MSWNLTGMGNSSGFLGLTQQVNTVLLGGWLGVLLLTGIGFVLYSSFYYSTRDGIKSMTGTLFIIFILGILFKALNLINGKAIFVIVIALAASVAFTWKKE